MNSRDFFYLVKRMRTAQKEYFRDRNRGAFLQARALENDVDREIAWTEQVLAAQSMNASARQQQA